MKKTILLTGATDGIGLETAKVLVSEGHTLWIHGRNASKLSNVKEQLLKLNNEAIVETVIADLSDLNQVKEMASEVLSKLSHLDVLINNAGIYSTPKTITDAGLEMRFVVNTIAPYLLTTKLLPIMDATSRVVNLSSAAQATVDLDILARGRELPADAAYAQSKLAITMWSIELAEQFKKTGEGPMIVAINPKSFLGSKMVKEAYGMQGHDLRFGVDILHRAALSDEFKDASGKYYDNDLEAFANPHPDALNSKERQAVIKAIEEVIESC